MRREQQQAQAQMALQLLQMLREGRQQDEKLALMRDQMMQEGMMGRRQMRMGQHQFEADQMQREAMRELEQQKLNQQQQQFQLGQQFAGKQMDMEGEKIRRNAEMEERKLKQDFDVAEMNRLAASEQVMKRNEGLMNPQILDYLQKVAMMPPGPDKDALMANLESLTGKKFVRPVNQFEQLVKGK